MSIEIREIDFENEADAAGLLNVLDSYARDDMGGGAPLRPQVRQRLIPALREQANALVLLAFEQGTVIGIATCFFGFSTFAARPLLNVHDLAVLPASRGRGVGRALLLAAEERARARGCAKLTLEVREDNARARGLYQDCGFRDFELAGAACRALFLAKPLATGGEAGIVVRPATLADTERALWVIRQSINQLCVLDHQNDAALLERWLANKTPEHFASWLAQADGCLMVAELDGVVHGVGNVVRSGKIHLCYVEPGFERKGLGAAILSALEARAHAWGLTELALESSNNARGFYARHGYQPAACAPPSFGVLRCYPFKKTLSTNR